MRDQLETQSDIIGIGRVGFDTGLKVEMVFLFSNIRNLFITWYGIGSGGINLRRSRVSNGTEDLNHR